MKKILLSLIAVAGILVAGDNSAKEVKICEGKGTFVKSDREMIFPNMRIMNCYSFKDNMQSLSNESFQELYKTGWRYVGTYSGAIKFENKAALPNSKEDETVYLIFERNK